MEREIKFRAWDKKLRKFHSDINEGYKNKIFQLFLNLSGQIILRGKEEGGDVSSMSCIDEYQERFEITQFTGLKDKNGKEIYEGDIIKDLYGLYIVKNGIEEIPDNEDYSSNTVCGFYLEQIGEVEPFKYGHFDYIESREIIGNIYENSNLL